jgi:hypothetical protein
MKILCLTCFDLTVMRVLRIKRVGFVHTYQA